MALQVPQIVAGVDVPSSAPAARVDPGDVGALATSGLRTTSRALDQLAQNLSTLEGQKLSVAGKHQAISLVTDYALALQDLESQLKQDPSPDHARRYQEGAITARAALMARIPDPLVRAYVQEHTEPLLRGHVLEAKRFGDQLYFDSLEASRLRDADRLIDLAAQTTSPVVRDTLLGQLEGLYRAAREGGVIRDPKLAKELKEKSAQFWEAIALREAQITDSPLALAEEVQNGPRFGALGPLDRLRVAERIRGLYREEQREFVRQQEKLEQQLTKAAEAARQARVDAAFARIDAGDMTEAELRRLGPRDPTMPGNGGDGTFRGAEWRTALERMRHIREAGGTSDPNIYNRLETRILAREHMPSRKEILHTQGLAESGPRSRATLLKMVTDEQTTDAAKDITKDPFFDQGLDDIKLALRGGKGPLESLEPVAATRLRNAIREYHDVARTGRIPPRELPEQARKIVDRYLLEQRQPIGDPAGAMQLRYRDPAALADAFRRGLIPEAEFNRQVDLFRQLGILPPPGSEGTTGRQPRTR
jgi:hypothetical protein